MRRLTLLARRLLADRRGATAVEYGLILACIVLAIFGAIQSVGSGTGAMWNYVSTSVTNAH